MKYIIYFILGTIWYAAFFFYNADTFFQQSIIITGYVVWILVYFLYYIPIDKKYQKMKNI